MKAQKRPLSYPFQNFLKRIMSDSLEEHDGKVSPGGRPVPICSLQMTLTFLNGRAGAFVKGMEL